MRKKLARHTPVLSSNKRIRALSADNALFPHLGDALTALTNDPEWEKIGDDIADIVAESKAAIESWYSDMLIGTVFPWLINPPSGWLLLDGSTYALADYPELADVIPAHLISGLNFTLPDIEDAFPFGVLDEDESATVTGSNSLTLSVAQLPSHNHTYTPPTLTISAETPVVPIPTAGIGAPIVTGSTGSGDDVDIRPKRFGLVYAVFSGRG